MSDENNKEKSYLDYEWEDFRAQMEEATDLLRKMNEAANYMRWQYEKDFVFKAFEKEMYDAQGWVSSWCG